MASDPNPGDRLRVLREARRLTQVELASLAKVPRSTIAKYESGATRRLGEATFAALSAGIGVPPSVLSMYLDGKISLEAALTDELMGSEPAVEPETHEITDPLQRPKQLAVIIEEALVHEFRQGSFPLRALDLARSCMNEMAETLRNVLVHEETARRVAGELLQSAARWSYSHESPPLHVVLCTVLIDMIDEVDSLRADDHNLRARRNTERAAARGAEERFRHAADVEVVLNAANRLDAKQFEKITGIDPDRATQFIEGDFRSTHSIWVKLHAKIADLRLAVIMIDHPDGIVGDDEIPF